jgi:hypothetical protein
MLWSTGAIVTEGPTAASEQFTIRSGMIEVLRPLQIDHTLADVFVKCFPPRIPLCSRADGGSLPPPATLSALQPMVILPRRSWVKIGFV